MSEKCPKCGSENIAEIFWGMPAMDEDLERRIEEGKIVIGGCCITGFAPDWHCNDCGCEFGETLDRFNDLLMDRQLKLKGVVYGAAVGDALGVPYEFLERDSFECTGMSYGGFHNMPLGTFSDDTSMLLATCYSIKQCGKIDIEDMRKRFRDWYLNGKFTPDGRVFGVGGTTSRALDSGIGQSGEFDNGNGSLMRIAPIAFTSASDDDVRAVSSITHDHWISRESCVLLVGILRDLIDGENIEDAIASNISQSSRFDFIHNLQDLPREEVKSTGFVLDTLGASLWCALHTDSFKDCVLAAVNLGGDSDTTGCVAGALAGTMYGYEAIPIEWINALRGKDVIEECLFNPSILFFSDFTD